METATLISFTIASFLMALMPGPDNLFVITESVTKGPRNGLWIAAGLNSGVLFHTFLAATGLSLLFKTSELAFTIIQYLGAVYLLYLAFQAWKDKGGSEEGKESELTTKESAWKLYRTGIFMNVLNPKVSLFFIAFLPQFVKEEASFQIPLQMLVLGVIFLLSGFITFASFALLAGQFRKILQHPKFSIITRYLKVIVLVVLASYLLY